MTATFARYVTFVGGPMDGQQRRTASTRTIEIKEALVGVLVSDPKPAAYETEPRRGTYERDPANPYRYQWKGWDA